MKKKCRDFSKFNSFIIAIILMTPAMITLLNNVLNIPISLSTLGIGIMISAFILISLVYGKDNRINIVSIVFLLLVLIVYLNSTRLHDDLNYSLFQLVFYIFIPIIICQQKFEIKVILKYVLILSIPLIFGINKMLVLNNVGLNQANMYNTYCFIPSIIAMITYFFYYKNEKKRFILIIASLCNIYYLVKVGITAVRGFWLVLIVYISLLLYLNLKRKESSRNYYSILFFTFLLLIIIYLSIDKIILFGISIFESAFGDNIGFFIKTKRLIEQGDFSNGRIIIWKSTIEYIFDNPIIGYGIEGMKYLTNGQYLYPHNFILQLVLDCGILGIYPLLIVIKTIISIFNKKNEHSDSNIILLYFISISIPIVFLSNDIWKFSALWILIGYGMSLKRMEKSDEPN